MSAEGSDDRRNYAEILAQHETRLDRLERDFHAVSVSMTRVELLVNSLTSELREHKSVALEMLQRLFAEHERKEFDLVAQREQETRKQWAQVVGWLVTTLVTILSALGWIIFQKVFP